MIRPVLFVNRMSDPNIGDRLSSPYLYFRRSYPNAVHREIEIPRGRRMGRVKRQVLKRIRDAAGLIVIGGGGLLGIDYFREDLAFWTAGPAPTALWGAGHNAHDPQMVAQSFPDESHYDQLVPFSAIGLRDWGPGFLWVPCASCMNPVFDRKPEKGNGTLFIVHRDLRDNAEAVRKILVRAETDHTVAFNDEDDASFFGKLAAARQVVTTSYHGAYWATLMQKPVVAIGGGTKVGMLKHRIPLSDAGHWPDAMRDAPVYPQALEECRDRNAAFHAHLVREFVGRQAPARRQVQDPAAERTADLAVAGQTAPGLVSAKVPRIVHFIFGLAPDFGGKPFNIMHYIAVRSVAERFKPDEIRFHYRHEPDNEFYRRIRPLLTLCPVADPEHYKGQYIEHFAHRADVIRLSALRETGGIYLDLDTITVTDLEPLLRHSFTIGLQGRRPTQGLCNAVIAAAPGDPFLADWFSRYDNFDAKEWDRFSVKLPYLMWRSGKHSINVEPYDRFHWPLWDEHGLKLMFEQTHRFGNAFLHHLWESRSYPRYFANESFSDAVRRVKGMRNSYSLLARPFLD